MEEKNVLKDHSLEALGLIKNIDTLSIIYEAEKIKTRKHNFFINLLGFITAFVIVTANIAVLFTMGVKIFLTIQLIMSWFILISFLPVLKREIYLGGKTR
jgi:pheromone shutdown protein TraB